MKSISVFLIKRETISNVLAVVYLIRNLSLSETIPKYRLRAISLVIFKLVSNTNSAIISHVLVAVSSI